MKKYAKVLVNETTILQKAILFLGLVEIIIYLTVKF